MINFSFRARDSRIWGEGIRDLPLQQVSGDSHERLLGQIQDQAE